MSTYMPTSTAPLMEAAAAPFTITGKRVRFVLNL